MDAATLLCPACETEPRPGTRFCTRCGQALSTDALGAARAPVPLRVAGLLYGAGLVVNLVIGLAGHFVDGHWPDLAALLLMGTASIAAAVIVRRSLRPLFSFRAPSARGFGTLVGAAILACGSVYMVVSIGEVIGLSTIDSVHPYVEAGVPAAWIIALMALVPGIGEEIAFRGIIQQSLADARGTHEAWLLQGILFGVAHLYPVAFISHTAFGLALGWLRVRTGSLYPGMLVHAGWNALVTYDELYPGTLGLFT